MQVMSDAASGSVWSGMFVGEFTAWSSSGHVVESAHLVQEGTQVFVQPREAISNQYTFTMSYAVRHKG